MITSKTSPSLVVMALLTVAVAACESITETAQRQPLSATLDGDSVKPTAVSGNGTGTFSATLSNLNGAASFDYELAFSALTGNATAAHLHGPASADAAGNILVDLSALPAGSNGTATLGATTGSAQGTLDLNSAINGTVSGDSLHVLLDAGLVYVDVHSATQAAGEIRGQIRKR